jgi:hypothetical protein
MDGLHVTHRIPRADTGCCPACGDNMRAVLVSSAQGESFIECSNLTPTERLRIRLEAAEDAVLTLKRQIERAERLSAS